MSAEYPEAISDKIVDALVADISEAVADLTGKEAVGVVKGGKLQDNPLKKRIYICVHIGDPDNDRWMDTNIASRANAPDRRLMNNEVAQEIGGGFAWYRRGVVQFGFFGSTVKVDRDEARRIASATRARIEQAIRTSGRIPGLADDFDEQAQFIHVMHSTLTEGGGPPASFIWGGKVYWQALTERNS